MRPRTTPRGGSESNSFFFGLDWIRIGRIDRIESEMNPDWDFERWIRFGKIRQSGLTFLVGLTGLVVGFTGLVQGAWIGGRIDWIGGGLTGLVVGLTIRWSD